MSTDSVFRSDLMFGRQIFLTNHIYGENSRGFIRPIRGKVGLSINDACLNVLIWIRIEGPFITTCTSTLPLKKLFQLSRRPCMAFVVLNRIRYFKLTMVSRHPWFKNMRLQVGRKTRNFTPIILWISSSYQIFFPCGIKYYFANGWNFTVYKIFLSLENICTFELPLTSWLQFFWTSFAIFCAIKMKLYDGKILNTGIPQ